MEFNANIDRLNWLWPESLRGHTRSEQRVCKSCLRKVLPND